MSGTRRKMTPEESSEYRADAGTRHKMSAKERAQHARGEAGNPGHDLYEDGADAHVDDSPTLPTGTAWDAAKTFANNAALGAGPQIAGVMGAIAHSATNPMQVGTTDVDAYRDVRDETARDLRASENTTTGKIAGPIGTLATPVPIKALGRGAGAEAHALQGLKVGGGVGVLGALTSDPHDFTKADVGDWAPILKRAVASGLVGAGGGGVTGGILGKAEPKLTATAEEQALKAAGLRGGITNQVQKKLGLSDMTEARALGRQFLDEDLIPFAGSKEAVQKRAEKLQGQAGNSIGGVLNQAEMSGTKFDFDALADAARAPILDPNATTAVERRQSGKAMDLADDLAAQGADTPGSFIGANRAKSKAWDAARFDDDAPAAAKLYRKAVGAARGDIERQVSDALGPEAAADLAAANQKYGVAADALKLSKNADTRDGSNRSLGLIDAIIGSGGAATGAALFGPGGAAVGGLGGALLSNLAAKRGNAAAARFSDFLAERAAQNSGGVVGAEGAGALAEYLGLLDKPPERVPPWEEFVKEKK